ncbi:hypothetical protein LTR67_002192 [Exophiala xenobiotica]
METSSHSQGPSAPTNEPPAPTTDSVYQSLSTYPFDADHEYQSGLAAILGHPDTPATYEELSGKSALVLQAQCFYFSRKFNIPAIDTSAYSSWVQSQSQRPDPASQPPPPSQTASEPLSAAVPSSTTEPPSSTTSSSTTQPPEPPYPTSFAHIVDLITRNIPVPGIEEIPDTILEPGTSKIDKTPRRKKPWEKDSDIDPDSGTATSMELPDPSSEDGPMHEDTHTDAGTKPDSIDLNGHKETGQGVVNILKPNAVPDSGLLAKD